MKVKSDELNSACIAVKKTPNGDKFKLKIKKCILREEFRIKNVYTCSNYKSVDIILPARILWLAKNDLLGKRNLSNSFEVIVKNRYRVGID